jgi:PAS domain-containing protein
MDNNDLMNVLESLLGPAVASGMAPAKGRATGTALEQRRGRDGVGAQPQTQRGSITALLSAEMPVGIAVLDARTFKIIRANAPLLDLLDLRVREDDVVGRPLSEIAPGLVGSQVEDAFRQVAQTGHPFSAIIEEDRDTGPTFRRCSLSAIRRRDGTFTDLLLTMFDVSDQMEARQRADYESQVAEERASRIEEQTTRASVRSAAVQALAHVSNLTDALSRVTERTAEALGDCCAVFLLGDDDVLQLAALYHRDRVQGYRLRAAYASHPLHRGEGIVGRVVLSGEGYLATRWDDGALARVPSEHRNALEDMHISSMVCVPLREAARSVGAVVLFSTLPQVRGSGHLYGGADLSFLQELADQIAQAAQNVRLRDALRAAQAEKEVLLEAARDGIAIYDAQGRLRHLNSAGRRLLSRPVVEGVERAAPTNGTRTRRTFLTPDGQLMATDQLPWSRALRGDLVGDPSPEPLIVEWPEGTHRALHVRAMPVEDASGVILGAVATLVLAPASVDASGTYEEPQLDAMQLGATEWARWRETMELLDDGVVLCGSDGQAVFINSAGRQLLDLDEAAPDDSSVVPADIWANVRTFDGSTLSPDATPAALALMGEQLREYETTVELLGGGIRRVFWNARRIDREGGDPLGVVLIARTTTEATPGTEALQQNEEVPFVRAVAMSTLPTTPRQPSEPPYSPALAPTTRLPNRVVPEYAPKPGAGAGECDLAEACARVARSHSGVQGRRLEVRLPRRRVMVALDESDADAAAGMLIAAGAAVMPPTVPLHVAVWVERIPNESAGEPTSPVPPGVAVDQINTMLLKPGDVPLAPPTRAVAPGRGDDDQISVAVVRVCSPALGRGGAGLRGPIAEPEEFVRCRQLVASMGGRAWAREDPLLGPTYSISVPLASLR